MDTTPQEEERLARQRLRRLEKARKARRRQAEARRRARPRRLAQVERRIDELGRAYRSAETFRERWAIRRELRELGQERLELRWGD